MKKVQLILLIFLVGVSGFAQEIIKLEIKENKVPCTGVAPMECLQVKEEKNKEWTYFYENIQGFNYEPGFTYKLKVEKNKKLGNLPADASAFEYKLKKVISKKKVKEIKVKKENDLDIFGKKLVLSQLNGKAVNNGSVYFEINESDKTISGKSGVNRFNSSFEFQNNELIVKPGMGTLMAGDPETMKLESEFNKALLTPFKVIQKGNEVQFLDSKSNKVVMILNTPSANDIWSFINDKEWKLFMLENVGKDFGNASITFNINNKKITGNNGCNRFFGDFSTEADEIKFGSLATTRMACTNDEAKETQDLMMKYLNEGTLRFDVAEQTLNLYQDNKLVMMFGLQK